MCFRLCTYTRTEDAPTSSRALLTLYHNALKDCQAVRISDIPGCVFSIFIIIAIPFSITTNGSRRACRCNGYIRPCRTLKRRLWAGRKCDRLPMPNASGKRVKGESNIHPSQREDSPHSTAGAAVDSAPTHLQQPRLRSSEVVLGVRHLAATAAALAFGSQARRVAFARQRRSRCTRSSGQLDHRLRDVQFMV